MKFECEKIMIEQEINHAKQINSSKNAYDLYSHILLRLEGSLLTLKATDSNFSFETCIPVLGYEDGEAIISSDKLLSLLQARTQKTVIFERKENKLEIKTEKESSKINLSYLKIALGNELIFPPVKKDEKGLKLNQKRLYDLISQTSYAVSTDENRPMLTGICLKVKNNSLNFVSTDGNRLALAKEENINYREVTYILPLKGLNFIKNLLNGEGEVQIVFEDNRVFFNFDRYYLSLGLIAGSFPSYENIIPEKQEEEISLSKSEFLESLKMASVMTDQRSKRIFLYFKENSLTISSEETEDGFTESEIVLESSIKNPTKLAFNSDYLMQALKVIEGIDILFSFTNANSISCLKPLNNMALHLVMPMNLN